MSCLFYFYTNTCIMHKLFWALLIGFPFIATAQKITTRFETSGGTESPAYPEIIDWWKKLDASSPIVQMKAMGPADAGFPLHLILVSGDKDFNIATNKRKGKSIIFILNGIHPGEPDGIDASMLMVRDIVEGTYKLPSNIVLAIIPVYNIGGCLNRSKDYRIDQNGPVEKGFRGDAQNLDLNRDFIKCDSKNARTFTQIFHLLDPDVFVDNHVSDGADYQHIMTLIATQHNKLGGKMGEFLNKQFEPALYTLMKEKGYDLVPYVNDFDKTPREGWPEFWDSPRYSSGYAALWSTFSFIPETHMLKPYNQRVKSTYALMQSFIEFTSKNCATILALRKQTKNQYADQQAFPIAWTLDKTKWKPITFKGYEGDYKKSEVSGLPRLYYDRSKPFTQQIPFYNDYTDTATIQKPLAYMIPQGWWKVIDLLKLNGVQMKPLLRDTAIEVESYHIGTYQSSPRPYEGHHPNSHVQVITSTQTIHFRKGDYYIPLNQSANRFLIETLEPQGEDSYFTWNFFDAVLGQKEGYSDYHFEDIAADYLRNNPEVVKELQQRKNSDTAFAKSASAQLNFVFKHSPYFEPAFLQYPVYRIIK